MPRPPPVTIITSVFFAMSASAQEKPVQVAESELVPSRPAVIAAAGALGLLHLPQQRVHLRRREHAVGPHRGVAGHRGEELVLPRREHLARAELADLVEDVAREAWDVAAGKQRGCRAHRKLART